MKRIFRLLACLALACAASNAPAQSHVLSQAELDALLAPIALYPDPLLAHVLNAAVYPQDVATAAEWSRANARLQGDDALRAVDSQLWHPSVKALVAYPDILARMAESPKWVADLGEAYVTQSADVTATVQELRARAQAQGNLQSNDQQQVYTQGDGIYVQPVYPQYAWVPYYDPYVVYGAWWWGPGFAPIVFRPFFPRRVVVTNVFVHTGPPLHWHVPPRPSVHTGGQWATQPNRPHSSPVRSFNRTNFSAPARQPQHAAAPHYQMPAASMRATPSPAMQHWARGPAFAGGWAGAGSGAARSAGGHFGGGGHGGGGHGGGRRG